MTEKSSPIKKAQEVGTAIKLGDSLLKIIEEKTKHNKEEERRQLRLLAKEKMSR